MTAEVLKLSGQKSAPLSLRTWLIGWVLVAAALTTLLWNGAWLDRQLWLATRWAMGSQDNYTWENYRLDPKTVSAQEYQAAPYYQVKEPPLHGKLFRRTEKLWRIFRDMGTPYMTVLVMIVMAIYDRRRSWLPAAWLLAGTVPVAGIAALVRFALGRLPADTPTPPIHSPTNLWESWRALWVDGFFPWLHISPADMAFPSTQATLALAMAAVLEYWSPRGKWLFRVLAGLCSLAPVIMQTRFYSDILAGAALGYTAAYVMVRWVDKALSGRSLAHANQRVAPAGP